MNKFYVYQYVRNDGTPYYIGKGQRRRAFDKLHNVTVPKDKSRIVFLIKEITNESAMAIERFWIGVFGRQDLGTGILRNKTDGGDIGGAHKGHKHSEETKRKFSQMRKGRKLSPETLEKLRIANTGRKMTPETRAKVTSFFKSGHAVMKGRKRNPESIKKMWITRHRNMALGVI